MLAVLAVQVPPLFVEVAPPVEASLVANQVLPPKAAPYQVPEDGKVDAVQVVPGAERCPDI